MSDIADRYRRIAADFTRRVDAVPDDAWDNPAPCEGWVARDVVGHLVEWLSGFFSSTWDLQFPPMPSVDDDPAGAWAILDRTIQAALDDPVVAEEERDTRMGTTTLEQTIDMICTNDVFMHAWDLARATGQDETLDPDEVHSLLIGMEPMDAALRESGHYGPRVIVPDDADEQTKLLAFIGRHP
ncbi:maleylpyruvate isomerase family mycothiol-dependent enzyme [soil metagenome]